MLAELNIRDFALIESLRLAFGSGLNVLTGETGAGKSIILDALQLVLGGRATAEQIRGGAREARVEALFDLSAAPHAARAAEAMGLLGPGETELLVARDVGATGRGSLRVNGRAATLAMAQELAQSLVEIHGQHEQQRLFRGDAQRQILDAFGGPEATGLGREMAELAGAWRLLQERRQALGGDPRERLRRLDLLRYEVEEIDQAAPRPGEEADLLERRSVLMSAGRLLEGAARAYAYLDEGDQGRGAAAAELGRLAAELKQLAAIDPRLDPVVELLDGAACQAEEAAREVRRYRDGLAFDPGEQDALEGRLELLRSLKRKYGESLEAVLAYRAEAAAEMERLGGAEAAEAALERERGALRVRLGQVASALSAARSRAARELEARVGEELGQVSLGAARLEVQLERRPLPGGLPVEGQELAWDATGIDRVAFLFSANPGESLKPLARVASGGEAARVMLALKAALAAADPVPTLIFDEVDAGLGGQAARAVAAKLAALGRDHQVLCVTHQASVAAAGHRHVAVTKDSRDGRTVVSARPLDDAERPGEIARMLAGDGAAETPLQHARELLTWARTL